jgi:hypothetical protein
MHNAISRKASILWIVIPLIPFAGCDDRATQIAREAANRQAQQNTAMAELNQEVAGGTRRLVEADAQARRQIAVVHRELQAERSRLDGGWNTLEQERQRIAAARRAESLLLPAVKVFGGLALVIVLLGFSWYALGSTRRDASDAQLNELLVAEFIADEPLLLPGGDSQVLLKRPAREELPR